MFDFNKALDLFQRVFINSVSFYLYLINLDCTANLKNNLFVLKCDHKKSQLLYNYDNYTKLKKTIINEFQ